MAKWRRFVLIAALLAFTPLGTPGAPCAAEFNQFVGFGDSTLDSGYFRYHSLGNSSQDQALAALIAQGATGAFVGNGVMNATILAAKFGLSAAPIGGGGTNYAVGGSLTATDKPPTVPVTVQIQNYLTSVNGAANPNALYIVKSGDNDLNFVPNPPNPDFLSQQAAALATSVSALQSAGARTIMAPNSYNSAVYAGLGGDIAPGNAVKYANSESYMSARWAALTAAGVRFIPADLDSLFRYVVHNPASFGFTASSVLASNAPYYPNPPNSALFALLTPVQQQTFLFIDGVHMTTAGQTLEADYEYSLLIAPSQISLLAESVVQDGLSRAATIQGQIDLSSQHRGPGGINVWASAGAGTMRYTNDSGFPNDSGIPFGGSVGVDYLTSSGVILGVAFTAGSRTQGFSTGGDFTQTDQAMSIYAAYRAGPVWGNLVASYGLFQDDVSRQVPLGIFTDQNHADTSGQSLALALRGGGDFKLGQVTTGPVAGLVLQRVHVDDFRENGATGVTALSFGSQTRDSAVSQLGWRVLADVGKWQPFAEAKWNHEWADRNRTVTASLTSVAGPSYSMDAAPVASDWATTTLGTSYRLNPRMLLRASTSAFFFNPQEISYGGELGLNVSF